MLQRALLEREPTTLTCFRHQASDRGCSILVGLPRCASSTSLCSAPVPNQRSCRGKTLALQQRLFFSCRIFLSLPWSVAELEVLMIGHWRPHSEGIVGSGPATTERCLQWFIVQCPLTGAKRTKLTTDRALIVASGPENANVAELRARPSVDVAQKKKRKPLTAGAPADPRGQFLFLSLARDVARGLVCVSRTGFSTAFSSTHDLLSLCAAQILRTVPRESVLVVVPCWAMPETWTTHRHRRFAVGGRRLLLPSLSQCLLSRICEGNVQLLHCLGSLRRKLRRG